MDSPQICSSQSVGHNPLGFEEGVGWRGAAFTGILLPAILLVDIYIIVEKLQL